jgi:N,N-dimethylformamidase
MSATGIPFGYVDRWTVRPGETVHLKLSSELPCEVGLIRVRQGDSSAAGPGQRLEPQDWWQPHSCPARVQRVTPGSRAVSDPLASLRDAHTVEMTLLFRPSLLPAMRGQAIASLTRADGLAAAVIAVTADGHAELRLGAPSGERRHQSIGQHVLLAGRWYRATALIDFGARSAELAVASIDRHPGGPQVLHVSAPLDAAQLAFLAGEGRPDRLVLAAATDRAGHDHEHFNGKLETPVLSGRGGPGGTRSFRYAWRLGPDVGHGRLGDASSERAVLRLINAPTAAVTGHNWDGTALSFTAAPEQYAALAFHDDDLVDAQWETSASATLPESLASGVYAFTLTNQAGTRHVPFFVVPPAAGPRPAIAVLLPTFTYLAYANEHVRESLSHFAGTPAEPSRQDFEISAHRDFGLSLYDRHSDGTGVCYSATARPVLNCDPTYRFWLFGGPVHLGEDLYLLDWLDRLGHDYDILTDHLIDAEGAATLAGYQVVLTGSHPEYASARMLDALEAHVQGGGGLMYLGGNGFYWVTSAAPHEPHFIEIRRGTSGGRAWESEPGEGYHSTTGEPGGLWRHRGRPPNRLLGVGFSAQGADDHAPGYRRVVPSGPDKEWDFVFAGVEDEQAIGVHGLLLGGAAGNEIDRADPSRGTPLETVILATSTGHSDAYQLAVEDLLFTAPGQGGTEQPLVRSDIVVVPYQSGGMVFSVGSITWLGSLARNGYQNDVARITCNVLERLVRAHEEA